MVTTRAASIDLCAILHCHPSGVYGSDSVIQWTDVLHASQHVPIFALACLFRISAASILHGSLW